MPEYLYKCKSCGQKFDIIKRVADIDRVEACECGSTETTRLISLSAIDQSSCQQPYYEPALGCIVKSKGHKQRILKQRGLEEVGNTSPETLHKDYTERTQKRIAASWDDL